MPTLGAPLDLAKYEARNFRAHVLGAAPSSPVSGQMYYNSGDNTLYWYDGGAWVAAKSLAAAPPDATTSVKGLVQLAGDLTGTATSPQIAAGVITDAEINAANKDGAVGTVSMRTLGYGAAQAMPGNARADQIAVPTAAVSQNGQKITSLGDPSAATDAAHKGYVDSVAQGLDAKESVRLATTANITLSGNVAVDGVTTAPGDRILVKDQSTASQNGIYVAAAGAWARSTDADVWTELPGAHVFVEAGSTNADTGWVSTADAGGTINSTAVTFVQFSAAGQLIAGNALVKTGNTFDVGVDNLTIEVSSDALRVKANGILNSHLADGAVNLGTADVTGTLPITSGGTGQTSLKTARETGLGASGYYSSSTHSAGTTISIPQTTHGLRASRGLLVQVQDEATGNVELPDMSVAASGDVTVTYGASVTANSKRVTIVG